MRFYVFWLSVFYKPEFDLIIHFVNWFDFYQFFYVTQVEVCSSAFVCIFFRAHGFGNGYFSVGCVNGLSVSQLMHARFAFTLTWFYHQVFWSKTILTNSAFFQWVRSNQQHYTSYVQTTTTDNTLWCPLGYVFLYRLICCFFEHCVPGTSLKKVTPFFLYKIYIWFLSDLSDLRRT